MAEKKNMKPYWRLLVILKKPKQTKQNQHHHEHSNSNRPRDSKTTNIHTTLQSRELYHRSVNKSHILHNLYYTIYDSTIVFANNNSFTGENVFR